MFNKVTLAADFYKNMYLICFHLCAGGCTVAVRIKRETLWSKKMFCGFNKLSSIELYGVATVAGMRETSLF